jgi:hypothetical protein
VQIVEVALEVGALSGLIDSLGAIVWAFATKQECDQVGIALHTMPPGLHQDDLFSPRPSTRVGRKGKSAMTPNDVKVALNEVLVNGVSLNASAYLVFILGWVVAGAVGAFVGAFFGKRAETAAVRRDLETIKETLRQTTAVTETIKADISGALSLEQKRWDRKWEAYVELVKSLGEIRALIREAMRLDDRSPDYARSLADNQRGVAEAFLKFRQFGSVARIAVAPSVRTVLSRIGDEWNRIVVPEQLGVVAYWGWLVITDIARNDLFGERREMSDEFVGDVDSWATLV